MPIRLRDGSSVDDPRLAALREPARETDVDVAMFLDPDGRPFAHQWSTPRALDQGWGGACVGFAWAHALASAPIERSGVDATFAIETIYWAAQRADRYPGGEYPGASPSMSGTTVRAAGEALVAAGELRGIAWVKSIDALLLTLTYLGPVVFGCRWFREFDRPAGSRAELRPCGPLVGRHCVVLVGLEPDDGDVWVLNSRGPGWGLGGRARLSLETLERLWIDSEACLGLPQQGPPR